MHSACELSASTTWTAAARSMCWSIGSSSEASGGSGSAGDPSPKSLATSSFSVGLVPAGHVAGSRSRHIRNLENVKKPRPIALSLTSQRLCAATAVSTASRYEVALHSSPSGRSGRRTPNVPRSFSANDTLTIKSSSRPRITNKSLPCRRSSDTGTKSSGAVHGSSERTSSYQRKSLSLGREY